MRKECFWQKGQYVKFPRQGGACRIERLERIEELKWNEWGRQNDTAVWMSSVGPGKKLGFEWEVMGGRGIKQRNDVVRILFRGSM